MRDPFTLQDRTVVVTGASSGLGRQIAIAVAAAGARVALVARDRERLEATRAELVGGPHHVRAQDLTVGDELDGLADEIVAALGRVGGFVHAAGIERTLPLRGMRPHHYAELTAINVTAAFELTRILTRRERVREEGASFLFLASVMGIVAQSGLVGYCSDKGALIAGCRAMALELAPRRIRVNCVSPGYVRGTGIFSQAEARLPREAQAALAGRHPLGLGAPEDVAAACVFLLSDAARWITGSNLVVDGGYSIA